MSFIAELQSKNFALYGQLTGVLSIILLIILGILGFIWHIVFSVIGFIFAAILIFVEVPLCLRVCPTSPKFGHFIDYFENCYFRTILYFVMAVVMFLSNLINVGPLIAAAVSLLFASIFYGIAAVRGQPYVATKYLGGRGVSNEPAQQETTV
ncbi:hypothetical protein BC940DRAFT_298806 [Gongronella butleri]|nr:hypothetical protein BC940DRAFT_298806 [Gongronella butleri]